jgi:hypothetical protein
VLACAGFSVASTEPDALETVAHQLGLGAGGSLVKTPLADYRLANLQSGDLAQAAAGVIGIAIVYVACLVLSRMIAQRRSV